MNSPLRHGLRENLKQFTLLVIINGFVGGMAGMERSILPQLADEVFGVAAATAVMSFIIAFGVAKAVANYFAGYLAGRFGRKKILVGGWILAIPVPLLLMYAPTWNWVVAANILLGIHQGFAWSATVMMKIDLVGERRRGLAMGLNEFAGYIAVALFAFITGYIAGHYGVRPYPFIVGFILVGLGLAGSIFLVDETSSFARIEAQTSSLMRMKNLFTQTSLLHRNLGPVTQAGLVNNMNDGMVWGILPILLATSGFSLAQIGATAAVYPAVWGFGQIFTGQLADRYCKKRLLFIGMLLQAAALLALAAASTLIHFVFVSVVLGVGTAMVYPTFLATIADNTHPLDRSQSVGVFRLWRDLGYAIGALATGVITDHFGIVAAILFIGMITLLSAIIIQIRMRC